MCAHMLCPRENAGCAVYLGHIYVGGGRDEINLELCAIGRLSPETMRWTPVKRMRNKRDNVSPSGCVRPKCRIVIDVIVTSVVCLIRTGLVERQHEPVTGQIANID